MITTESLTIHGRDFVRYASDGGYYIQQVETGALYAEAVDPASVTGRTYTETETLIEAETAETEEATGDE